MMESAIALVDVCAARGGVEVLRGVTFSVGTGEVVALVGRSGCGKSTILRVILGLLAPSRGRVELAGRPASEGSRVLVPCEARNLGMVFQDLALWPHMTVRENLAFAIEGRTAREERERRIDEMLRRVSLLEHKERRPGELSGGERQRVAIARALILEPTAVLLDEPLANLDVLLRRQLLTFFKELLRERGMSALYVTHDPREVTAVADRLVITDGGEVVGEGTIDELRSRPQGELVSALLNTTS